jgi:hypothetical protein
MLRATMHENDGAAFWLPRTPLQCYRLRQFSDHIGNVG